MSIPRVNKRREGETGGYMKLSRGIQIEIHRGGLFMVVVSGGLGCLEMVSKLFAA